MMDAVADGFYNTSMNLKMTELEKQKNIISIRLEEAKREITLNSPSEEMIYTYLKKDSDIKNKTSKEQKSIINSYIKKVIVNEENIEIVFVVDINGGGEPYEVMLTTNILNYRHLPT